MDGSSVIFIVMPIVIPLVLFVDGHDYRTFQPLLYQVSTGYLGPEEVGAALRAVFRRQANVRVRIG
jgi:NADH:ubiquinone reductase (H+-translocating)